MVKRITLIALLLISPFTLAQKKELTIEDLGWTDRTYLDRQVERIDELARTELGAQLRNDYGDLTTLQQIVDRELIKPKDTEGLQALGAVLANVMLKDVSSLEWKIYEDPIGRTRALCAKNTKECLFPITMLSRRMEKGLKPNVKKVYEEGLALLDAHVMQMPYGGGPERRLMRK
jgi:hypothetical protein